MLELANEPAPSGGVHGFAVCLPQVRLVDPKPRDKEAPVLKHAYGMTRLVDSLPELKAALINFKGALPSRRQTSPAFRSEEHTSELQSLMRISYAVFCLKKKKHT